MNIVSNKFFSFAWIAALLSGCSPQQASFASDKNLPAQIKAEQPHENAYKSSDFVAAPTIPQHPGMDRYVGKWTSHKSVELEIARDARGHYYLSRPSYAGWNYLYNDVHWVGDTLHFQVYTYSDDQASFRYPKHKLLTPTTLVSLPDGNLREDFTAGGDPYMSLLMRIK